MKIKKVKSSDLQRFQTFSAHFFINTSELTRDSVHKLPEEEINRLADLLLSQSDIASYLKSEVGLFKDSKEKKIQAISYFIDNKEKFLEKKQEQFDKVQQRQEELASLSEKVRLEKDTNIESSRIQELEQIKNNQQKNKADMEI